MEADDLEVEAKAEEDRMSLAEVLALRKVPDHHARPLMQYVGDTPKTSQARPLREWLDLYDEMMTKPTGMTTLAWHEARLKQKAK